MTKRGYAVVTFDVCVTEQASLVTESLQQLSNKHGVLHQKPAACYMSQQDQDRSQFRRPSFATKSASISR